MCSYCEGSSAIAPVWYRARTKLKEWLIGRVADDNDIVIDELQEEHADMFEMEDEKRGIKVGKKTSIQCIFVCEADL